MSNKLILKDKLFTFFLNAQRINENYITVNLKIHEKISLGCFWCIYVSAFSCY